MPRFYIAGDPPRLIPDSEVASEGEVLHLRDGSTARVAKSGTLVENVVAPGGRLVQANLRGSGYEFSTSARPLIVGWRAGADGRALPELEGGVTVAKSATRFAVEVGGLVLDLDGGEAGFESDRAWLIARGQEYRELGKKRQPEPVVNPQLPKMAVRRSMIETATTAGGIAVKRAVVEADGFDQAALLEGFGQPLANHVDIATAVARRCGVWAQAAGLAPQTVVDVEEEVRGQVVDQLWSTCLAKVQADEVAFTRVARGEATVELEAIRKLVGLPKEVTVDSFSKVHRDRLSAEHREEIERNAVVGPEDRIRALAQQVTELAALVAPLQVELASAKAQVAERDAQLAQHLQEAQAAAQTGIGRAAAEAIHVQAQALSQRIADVRHRVIDERNGELRSHVV